MEYEKGYVYDLMDQGGPTKVTEPYFKDAVDEMMRARTLCAKANAVLPDDRPMSAIWRSCSGASWMMSGSSRRLPAISATV